MPNSTAERCAPAVFLLSEADRDALLAFLRSL